MVTDNLLALVVNSERAHNLPNPLDNEAEAPAGQFLRSEAKHLRDIINEVPQGDSPIEAARMTAEKFRAAPMQDDMHALAHRISEALDTYLDHGEIGALAIFAAPEMLDLPPHELRPEIKSPIVLERVENVAHLSEQALRQVVRKALLNQPLE